MSYRPDRDGRVSYGLRAPAPRMGKLPVLKIIDTGWTDVVILTSRVYGVELYYSEPRTLPVTDAQRANPDVYASLVGKRWAGYLAVRCYRQPTVFLTAITPVTVACVPQLADDDFDLRGWCIGLAREGHSKRARLKGRWNNLRAPDLAKLPHPPDIVAHLEYLWGAPLHSDVDGKRAGKDRRKAAAQVVRDLTSSLEIPT
jgi:hypothetical protein